MTAFAHADTYPFSDAYAHACMRIYMHSYIYSRSAAASLSASFPPVVFVYTNIYTYIYIYVYIYIYIWYAFANICVNENEKCIFTCVCVGNMCKNVDHLHAHDTFVPMQCLWACRFGSPNVTVTVTVTVTVCLFSRECRMDIHAYKFIYILVYILIHACKNACINM